ncbi:hypothetical protein HNQ50_001426 [Silvimonas terrae]|uniref:Uncharacterized protein n=1 Tax=Silvimonas terrae TaxID=300266 RepID=A0A840RDN9_9NEIS|nr:hypothetical protein [Silvimonas terrae]MBB5190704.1 hypothetical protein [Silvimonas terrae]
MQTLRQSFTTGGTWNQATFARLFVLIDTPNPINVRLYNTGGKMIYEATGVEAGFYTVPEENFARFEIDNAYAGGSVKVGVSQSDKAGYNRVGGKIDAKMIGATSVVNVPFKTVGTTETALAAANQGRASLRIWNNSSSDVFIGAPGLNINDAAIKLAPGGLWIETDAPGAAWVALVAAGTAPVKVQEIIW